MIWPKLRPLREKPRQDFTPACQAWASCCLRFLVCISASFTCTPLGPSEHRHVGHLCPFTELERKPTKVIFPRKTALGDDHTLSPGTLNPQDQPTLTLSTYQVASICQEKLLALFLLPPPPSGSSVWASCWCLFRYMQGRISTRFFPFSKQIPVFEGFLLHLGWQWWKVPDQSNDILKILIQNITIVFSCGREMYL